MPSQRPYGEGSGLHVEWVTVRHRTVYLLLVSGAALLLGAAAVYYFGFQMTAGREDESPPPEVALQTGAHFVEITGTVKIRKAGTYAWIDAEMGIPLQKDDHVRTDSKSAAQIRFFDGTEYFVKPDTILVIEETHEDPSTNVRRVAVKLTTGRVNLQTPARNVAGSRSELATPNTEASFDERTIADVRYDEENQTSGFTVFRGSTDLRAGEERVKLSSNEEVKVSAGSSFSEIVRLPGIPTVESPAHLSTQVHRDPANANTVLKWHVVEGVRRYHAMLDRTPNFSDPIWESRVQGLTAVVPGLATGTYYWKVSAVDGESREGGFSEFAKFSIATRPSDAEPPKLLVSQPAVSIDGVVRFNGVTDPDAVVTVNDERVKVKPDGSFQHYFIIGSPGRHDIVVKAHKRSGGTAEKVFQVTVGSGG